MSFALRSRRALALGVALTVLPLAGQHPPSLLDRCFGSEPAHVWGTPPLFTEVSGLALTDDGRLLLHNDEQGLVAAMNPATGTLLATYRLGPGTPRADFEGIAVAGERLFLVTSTGQLYESRVPPPGAAEGAVLPYRVIPTGLEKLCEIEGLAYDPPDRVLLLACKNPYKKSLEDALTVFRWAFERGTLADPDRISVKGKDLAKGRPGKKFRASGLERNGATGHYLAVAGPDQAIAEFDAAGRVIDTRELPRRHRQAEGIAISPAGMLIIGDEGRRGGSPGTVTVYACR